MKARAFSYARPSTVEEALETFASAGDEASYIAGGQSLVPALALRLQAPQLLIDIAHIPALRGIARRENWLRIGALTRHCEVLTDPNIARYAPLLREAAPHVAHPAIRNRGTLGGSVALADPASEFPAMMLAMGAELEIAGPQGTRRVAADDYFIDLFQTAIEPGELLIAIHVPAVGPHHRWAFDELARRRGDYAIIGCGMLGRFAGDRIDEIRVAFFSVGNTPVRARHVETALTGGRLGPDSVAEAQASLAADLSPPDDEHTPAAMRLHLARVLMGRLLGRMMVTG
ncbi:xanthine dehydrogenase family protein subunit M [Bradyrhizobium sp. LHD-71]|uniref:FAD binding domain-containing protein n=1 Tax=Bradyrhizobium sp. LHD-71 TaxID=3072141 RepID=UPI00280DB1F6|nr:xanthine dehydrogenase family protein subunit M [Bradyrhizobium sp. LHD-71]MDQ8726171.1 xanthine dehydrogenase family protein subunit M [Bradyrhizobium sp. LHD-71]